MTQSMTRTDMIWVCLLNTMYSWQRSVYGNSFMPVLDGEYTV